ncbi:MAG TPA: hypothetical protein VFD87_01410 [Phototrophicaceae bacterium]|nr:hypothetical protein [Phototrophicaceae bacterium]
MKHLSADDAANAVAADRSRIVGGERRSGLWQGSVVLFIRSWQWDDCIVKLPL